MRPIAMVLFAVLARVLWAWPAWVAVVAGAGVGVWFLIEAWRAREHMKAFAAQEMNEDLWAPCTARKMTADGFEVQCVKRAGHDGDESEHLASRGDLYWPGN